LSVLFQLRDYFIKFNHGQRQQNGDAAGAAGEQLDQNASPPGLPEIEIRENAFANHFAAFKNRLAPAAGKIGTIFCLARELGLVGVAYENVFSRNAVAGKNFPEKLFTSSHNSQNGNLFDTQLAFQGTKAHFP
jgi:hypothetical protein